MAAHHLHPPAPLGMPAYAAVAAPAPSPVHPAYRAAQYASGPSLAPIASAPGAHAAFAPFETAPPADHRAAPVVVVVAPAAHDHDHAYAHADAHAPHDHAHPHPHIAPSSEHSVEDDTPARRRLRPRISFARLKRALAAALRPRPVAGEPDKNMHTVTCAGGVY